VTVEIKPLEIPDVFLILPVVHQDGRGFFMETYRQEFFEQAGLKINFVQDNHSRSSRGVLRGLHYQVRQPQGKLVRVAAGEIFDAVVDLRRSSPTFGRWVGARLSVENKQQLWIPAGFAHGFLVLSAQADVLYKTSDYYAPQWERTLLWNDPKLGIAWPLKKGQEPLVSVKDSAGKKLDEAETYE
jgi:dTDP-4-dehydrorhamnose 3,5-epimerase